MTMSAPKPAVFRSLRRALLLGCAAAGLAGAAGQANAQAFNGNPTTIFGNVGYNRATPGVETVTVNTNTAVINWQPTDPLVFLPGGNTATFVNGPNNADFVVLNRILATTPMRFDGTVLSFLVNPVGGAQTGGTVIFSSPGGIIVGPTGVFDVGNLVLTTLNVNVDGAGNFYDPATRGLNFNSGGPSPLNGAIITEPGAQLRALEPNSFIALVAPIIQHGGATRVNGSAAYIAGEQVQFRANQGLFDIIVDVGSGNPFPLIHTGSTGGPASTGAGDNHAIYLVAAPKNQVITAFLSGDIGFDPAVAVGVENGVIVLSAGANIVGGTVDRYGATTGVPAADIQANFEINSGIVRSDLIGVARTNINARPAGTPSLIFQQDVSLFGGAVAAMSVRTGQSIDVFGNAIVSAAAFNSFSGAFNLTGGQAGIFTVQGGTIHIVGTATVDASARGLVSPAGDGGSGTGGTARVAADGGSIIVDGALNILATGEGGSSLIAPVNNGGQGQGGTATLSAASGGTVTANGTVGMNANGTASASGGGATVDAASGTGGTVNVLAGGAGNVVIAGAFTASANGAGGSVFVPGLAGGLGDGGAINVRATDGNIDFNADAAFVAAGGGGLGASGGTGLGGDLSIEATRGTIDFLGQTNANVGGFGGDAVPGGAGGTGQGGNIVIAARSSDAPSRIGGGAVTLTAPGQGGRGGNGAVGVPTGTGGDGTGGTIFAIAESANGTVALGALKIDADGLGGDGGDLDSATGGGAGGTGQGGEVLIGTVAGAAPGGGGAPTGSATFFTAELGARGTGGSGGLGTGPGGSGTGGTVGIAAAGAPATVTGPTTLIAEGRGGPGGPSPVGPAVGTTGQGTGGSVILLAEAGNGTPGALVLAGVTGSANAQGGPTGNVAGEWHVGATGGGTVTATNLTLTAAAAGTGIGLPPASTLDPQGGTITVTGTAQLGTDGDIIVNAALAGRIAGGRYELTAGRDVVVNHVTPAVGAFTFDVANLFVQAGRDVTVNAGAVTRTTQLTDIRAVRLATVAGRVLGRDILLRAADLNVVAGGALGDAATLTVDAQVTGTATVNGQILGQDILLAAATIGVGATGQVGSAASDNTELRATGAATVNGAVLGSDVLVTAGSLNVGGTGAIGDATTQNVNAQITGAATVAGRVLGRNILVNAASINLTTTGVVGGAATDLADLNATGLIGIAGQVRGDAIRLASADIDVGTTGTVGDATTQLVTLAIAPSANFAVLGGATQGPGYTLTGAEAGRIRADTLRVNAPALGANPALIVRDLTLTGGGAAAGIGLLDIVTPGVARVEGALLMTGARPVDGIAIAAAQRLEVVTPTASVRVRDGTGAPGGTLALSSANIWIASSAIIDLLRVDPNYAGRDDDLIDNDGVDAPRGYIEGAGVTLTTRGTLYVQNTTAARGTFVSGSEFGGITTGAGGLTIVAGVPNTNVYAFGRRLNADGTFQTGDAYFFASTYNSNAGSNYTPTAALNTCIIVTGQCPLRVPPDTGVDGPDPFTGPTDGSVAIMLPQNDEDDIIDSSFAADPLIEEPVTSGSEPGLWNCDPDHDGDCDDQPQ